MTDDRDETPALEDPGLETGPSDEDLLPIAAHYLRKARDQRAAAELRGRTLAAMRRGQDRERGHRTPGTVADLQGRAAERRSRRAARMTDLPSVG